MSTRFCAVIFAIAIGTVAPYAQQGEKPQQIPSISQRPSGASLGTIRIGAADNNIWFGWRVAMPANAIKGMTLSDALARADAPLGLAAVEAPSTLTVSFEVPKPLDHRLQAGERNAVNYRLRELNQQILAYRVENMPADDATRRRIFELAKGLNAPANPPLVIIPVDAENLAGIDALARGTWAHACARQPHRSEGRDGCPAGTQQSDRHRRRPRSVDAGGRQTR